MATPGMFKQAIIEEQGIRIPYVGGGLECNNPTDITLREISLVFPNRPVACVVSVGSGQLHSASIPDTKIYDALCTRCGAEFEFPERAVAPESWERTPVSPT